MNDRRRVEPPSAATRPTRGREVVGPDDDDWGQAGTLVRDVMNDAKRDRLVDNIVGHLLDGVTEPVLQRAVEYFCNVDADLGEHVEKGVRAGPLVQGADG